MAGPPQPWPHKLKVWCSSPGFKFFLPTPAYQFSDRIIFERIIGVRTCILGSKSVFLRADFGKNRDIAFRFHAHGRFHFGQMGAQEGIGRAFF